jgi:hypothetical protein
LPTDPLIATETIPAASPLALCESCAERLDRHQKLAAQALTGFVILGILAFIWGISSDHLRGFRYTLKDWRFLLGAIWSVAGVLALIRTLHVRMRRRSDLESGSNQ